MINNPAPINPKDVNVIVKYVGTAPVAIVNATGASSISSSFGFLFPGTESLSLTPYSFWSWSFYSYPV